MLIGCNGLLIGRSGRLIRSDVLRIGLNRLRIGLRSLFVRRNIRGVGLDGLLGRRQASLNGFGHLQIVRVEGNRLGHDPVLRVVMEIFRQLPREASPKESGGAHFGALRS